MHQSTKFQQNRAVQPMHGDDSTNFPACLQRPQLAPCMLTDLHQILEEHRPRSIIDAPLQVFLDFRYVAFCFETGETQRGLRSKNWQLDR